MTCSAAEAEALPKVRRRIFLALFTALAVALHTLEALLPSPTPWFRPGFANVLTLLALFLFDARAAWTVTLARIGVGSLFLGQFFAPAFLLSLSGGIAATSVMTAVRRLVGRRMGPVGISVLGAAAHAAGQMLIAWTVLVRHPGVWNLFPFLLLFSLLTGIVNGLAADLLLEQLLPHSAFRRVEEGDRLRRKEEKGGEEDKG